MTSIGSAPIFQTSINMDEEKLTSQVLLLSMALLLFSRGDMVTTLNVFALLLILSALCTALHGKNDKLPQHFQACMSRLDNHASTNADDNAKLRYCTQRYIIRRSIGKLNRNYTSSELEKLEPRIKHRLIYPMIQGNQGNQWSLGPVASTQRRVRKEYRMLTERERSDFHRAINLLKEDKSVLPNKYDAIASLHVGWTAENAHEGPSFLVWHRLYTLMMEEALRDKVPTVTLPFWDPTLDSSLENSRDSIIWSENFLGTSNGVVHSGPFAKWKTPSGPLIRNVAFIDNLPTTENINDVLSRDRLRDISEPNANERYNFEFHHNNMHDFIGGQVGYLATAPMDPAFWLIHSYVDLIWTRFYEKQQQQGIDPRTDYPTDYGAAIFAPDKTIGLKNMTIMQAIKESISYTSIYKYDYESLDGDCSLDSSKCNSPYLRCVNKRCQTVTRKTTGCGSLIPYQNQFCIDGVCDLNEWAFLPVEVIHERSFDSSNFGNFPVIGGHANLLGDIYRINVPPAAAAENVTKQKTCKSKNCCGPAGRVTVQASGINYFGNYQEMTLVDRRLAVSSEIAYIGIKRPTKNGEIVFITASERCGRICRPVCIIPGTNPPQYKNCTGWIRLTSDPPHFYGKTLEEAYMKAWDYSDSFRPRLRHENIPITFYCDDSRWPFNSFTDHANPIFKNKTTTMATTTLPPTTTTIPFKPKTICKVRSTCSIPASCSCRTMQKYPCQEKCNKYAVCIFGRYILASCRPGFIYDANLKECVRGICRKYFVSN